MHTPAQARQLWIDALRSGDYVQCRSHLCIIDQGYCCLGVACEVYQQHVGDLEITETYGNKRFDDSLCLLPPKVMAWLGLRNEVGSYGDHSLTALNDALRYDFAAIAHVIESNPPGLCVA